MGLIDRAIGKDTPVLEPAMFSDRIDPGQGQPIDLDLDALHRGGFFTPGKPHGNQPFELRSIKRRLLRRLGMLQRSTGNQRTSRGAGRPRNLVLVTSTRPSEGKTFTAINLALSFAYENKQSVLLIDGDAPRPKLRKMLNLPEGPGLTDKLLTPKLGYDECLYQVQDAPLQIMSEGKSVGDATALYSSTRAQAVFADIATRNPNRLVIVDAPPLLATTETVALARHVDEVIFVVEADKTPEPSAAAALDELLELNPNVSLVLNRCLVTAGGSHYEAYEHYDRPNEGTSGTGEKKADRARGLK